MSREDRQQAPPAASPTVDSEPAESPAFRALTPQGDPEASPFPISSQASYDSGRNTASSPSVGGAALRGSEREQLYGSGKEASQAAPGSGASSPPVAFVDRTVRSRRQPQQTPPAAAAVPAPASPVGGAAAAPAAPAGGAAEEDKKKAFLKKLDAAVEKFKKPAGAAGTYTSHPTSTGVEPAIAEARQRAEAALYGPPGPGGSSYARNAQYNYQRQPRTGSKNNLDSIREYLQLDSNHPLCFKGSRTNTHFAHYGTLTLEQACVKWEKENKVGEESPRRCSHWIADLVEELGEEPKPKALWEYVQRSLPQHPGAPGAPQAPRAASPGGSEAAEEDPFADLGQGVRPPSDGDAENGPVDIQLDSPGEQGRNSQAERTRREEERIRARGEVAVGFAALEAEQGRRVAAGQPLVPPYRGYVSPSPPPAAVVAPPAAPPAGVPLAPVVGAAPAPPAHGDDLEGYKELVGSEGLVELGIAAPAAAPAVAPAAGGNQLAGAPAYPYVD